ncbi:MAG TPA: DMT family transporter [Gemmatimonadales bacterium]
MNVVLVSVLLGLLGGVAVGFQNPLAAQMGRRVGILESAFIIHLGGALLAGIPLLLAGGGGLGRWREVPWYALWAGGLGVVLVTVVSYIVPRIGIAPTVALLITAQLGVSVVLDHYGLLELALRPVDPARVAGLGLLLVGCWLVLR